MTDEKSKFIAGLRSYLMEKYGTDEYEEYDSMNGFWFEKKNCFFSADRKSLKQDIEKYADENKVKFRQDEKYSTICVSFDGADYIIHMHAGENKTDTVSVYLMNAGNIKKSDS